MTRIKENSPILKSVIQVVEIIHEQNDTEEKARLYFQSLYNRENTQLQPTKIQNLILDLFTEEDIEEAIKSVNFGKGIGPDLFDGNWLKDPEIKKQFI